MALTEQQKAENKAANNVRDKAHSARYRAYRAAIEAAESSPEVQEARRVFDAADAAANEARASRDARVREIEEQIAGLHKLIAAIRNSFLLAEANALRESTAEAWHSIKQSKVADVEARFPDLQGNAKFSAPGWNPPQDVLDAMEAARRTATPELLKPKKARRSA